MIQFPNIDPVAVHIGSFGIRWYSLAYMVGILLGWWLIAKENARKPLEGLSKAALDDIIVWAVCGIVLGGRIGHILFYQPEYYLQNPVDILKIWEGGMSFHGGFLGTVTAFYLFCRKYNIKFLGLMDLIACVAPVGLFFGRIANFINGELYGRVTSADIGMIFPHGGDEPRHPSQLYEAALEGLFIFIVMMFLLRRTNLREESGKLSGIFVILYAAARIICEYFREPEGYIIGITTGQFLSVPMIIVGLYLTLRKKHES